MFSPVVAHIEIPVPLAHSGMIHVFSTANKKIISFKFMNILNYGITSIIKLVTSI